MKFIVDRKTWYRGKSSEESRLLREDGRRCCIGFVAQQCGIEDSLILGRSAIVKVVKAGPVEQQWPEWMKDGNDIGLAYMANDNISTTDQEREDRLTQIFADNGDEIEFIN